MKIITCLFLMLGLAVPQMEEEKIPWSSDQKLTWSDFRGIPSTSEEYVASTNSGISFAYSMRQTSGEAEIQYTVISNFYPDLSWYRPKRVNDYILEHEQTHFDISELHARKIRRALSNLSKDLNFKEAAEEIYNTLEAERRAMQLQYDAETDHSNRKSEEYRWRTFVEDQLKALESWK